MKTPILDGWFGENRPTVDLQPKPTQFAHCEENIRDLCDTFADETEWHLDPITRKTIVAGARDFYETIGDRPDLLRDALRKMKRMTLSFSSPRSCITFAREMLEHEGHDTDWLRRPCPKCFSFHKPGDCEDE